MRTRSNPISILFTGLTLAVLSGCVANSPKPDPNALPGKTAAEVGDLQPEPFRANFLLKSDLDRAAELTQREGLKHLRELMVKLYKRNPNMWRLHSTSHAAAVNAVFGEDFKTWFEEFGERRGGEIVNLAFDPEFSGDRVRAFIAGLLQMYMSSFNDTTEIYMNTQLDPQRLYNMARNLERASWLLNHKRDAEGQPYLIANSIEGDEVNLSFERQFGKLIAQQDMLAQVLADKENRTITWVVHSVATVFLPI